MSQRHHGRPFVATPVARLVGLCAVILAVLTILAGRADARQDASEASGGPPAASDEQFAAYPAVAITRIGTRIDPRTDAPPIIDGRLDEAVWATAGLIDDMRQVEPVAGAVPSERTDIRIMYDRDFLYVGFRCHDRDPSGIVATRMQRDAPFSADDRVSFVVDPFLDRRNAYFFEMNAAGARADGLVEDNSRLRRDWDGIWYGKVTIDEGGWTAEMAIPFKTLSFDPETTRWGFNASRFIRRRNEPIRWSAPTPDKSFNSIADAGLVEGIADIEQGVGLDVKPYGLFRVGRDDVLDKDIAEADAGLDLFYKLSPSLTLALTVNTDFAETEVDDRQVNLTRFPLFFPEKRDFFLQDAGIFNFGGINRNPLPFQSRRIGLGPGGVQRDILAGAKVTGRIGDLNLGLLSVLMKDDDELGQKNFFVGRGSVNVLEQSTIGAIFTAGDPNTTGDNYLAGLDFNYRTSEFGDDKVLEGNLWGQISDSSGVDRGQAAWGVKLGYPNDRVNWRMGFSRIEENFNAALGFVPRGAIHEYFGSWRYRWRPGGDAIRRIDASINGFLVTNLEGNVESRNLRLQPLSIENEAGDVFSADYSLVREVLFDPFSIRDGIVIPVGDYENERYSLRVATTQARPVSLGLRYSGGGFFSGQRDDYRADVEWRVSRHLVIGGDIELNSVDLPEGSFITRIMRGRVNIFFTPDLSWTNFIQYDNASDSIGINSRLRWIVEPGNELFVVLNQGIDRNGGSYSSTATELTTKLSWTFRF